MKRIAFVSGGSKGIGREIVTRLAASGCLIAVNYRSNKNLAELVCAEVNESLKATVARPYYCDLSDSKTVTKLFDTVHKELGGPISILVNNAGVRQDGLLARMSAETFSEVINSNLHSTFYCIQAALTKGGMLKSGGRIINISSIVGQIGNKGQCNYAAAKAGILGLTKAAAKEYASRNITVNAVCPGYIDTEFVKDISIDVNQIPLQRLGTVAEVAGLVHFLALDPAAAYITGHTITIDGGLAIGSS